MTPITSLAAMLALSASAHAALILQYDSTAAATNALERLAGFDTNFVTSSTSTAASGGADAEFKQKNATQTTVQGAGDGTDMMWQFGADDTSAFSASLSDAANGTAWIGFSFVAAQDLNITSFSFNMDPNNSSSNWAARDAGLFLSINGGTLTQFDASSTAALDVAHTGAITSPTFTDTYTVLSGQTVQFRLALTDRTNTGAEGNLPATRATRLGAFNVSAVAVPEPSAALLGALGSLMLLRRRR
ncbi:MAG: hypothetical protein NWT08_01810 [Akkermansiaceae bacterium]|nr:hypothetical protein [Akkermansiaceae bacterium]MDP4721022.1 hypothetical protein [Akkermansiaceae bacterium]MDP4781639.1 hypothetical protein [Akkermansiaceae bacterium]